MMKNRAMNSSFFQMTLQLFIICLPFLATQGLCDRVILKDGTVEESDRVWESERYIHFILKGTQSVEIRYAKEIVARIERSGLEPKENVTSSEIKKQSPLEAHPTPVPTNVVVQQPAKATNPHLEDSSEQAIQIDRGAPESNRNIKLYDPHRPQRYWASKSSRHGTMAAAMEALSKMYGKPVSWIEANIGDENDLGIVHGKLLAAYDKEAAAAKQAEQGLQQPLSLTQPSAQGASQSTEPINAVPTDQNAIVDRGSKADNLMTGQSITPLNGASSSLVEKQGQLQVSSQVVRPPNGYTLPSNLPVIQKGIAFYDPRRPDKYWSDEQHHHNSLSEALKALSDLYGVPVGWIEDHLGKSNDLYDVHQSIRESLRPN
ncbi:MAG: hypothetical protein M0036_14275 [Desulfobacteraceae bacterium]|nr:hypothetical protein [Desulfobacteraceae bacterium]